MPHPEAGEVELTFSLPADLAQAFRAVATRNGVTVDNVVEALITHFLDDAEATKTKGKSTKDGDL